MLVGHGDDYQGELIANFSSNVWYGQNNDDLFSHLNNLLPQLSRYPEVDAFSLRTLMAEKYSINEHEILICNGSAEAFYLIAHTYKEKKSLIVTPTFSEYEDACRLHDHEILLSSIQLLRSNIKQFQPDVVWICNPNNPNGYCMQADEVRDLLKIHPTVVFVLDQAYKDFTTIESIHEKEIHDYPNLILTQSLTKRYTVPGLRIGTILSCKAITHQIRQHCIPWNVNVLAIAAGKFLLKKSDSDFDQHITEWLIRSESLRMRIDKIGLFKTTYSQTPFFLVKLKKGKATDLKSFLLERKILVRDATNFKNLPGEYIRICALSEVLNELLINKLLEWSQQHI